jgi:TRAP-type transport system periplasmic protein
MSKTTLKVAIAVATVALAISPASAQKTLNAVTALQTNNAMSQSFLTTFAAPMTKTGAVTVNYIGGQEVVPPDKAAAALKRGQFDMLHSPSSYYIGTVPEAYAMLASNHGPKALRSNGAWELLQKIWEEKAGAYLLAWGESMTSYHMYLGKVPPMKDGIPDLTGFKMRATGTYRPLFRALGATTINIKSSEVINAMQRGTIDGFGFTDQPASVGMQEVIKYRVIPNFYQTNTVITINSDVWKSLTDQERAAMTKVAIEYETTSVEYSEGVRQNDEAIMKKAGVQDIVLKGEGAEKYLEIAHGEIWKELAKRSTHAEALKPLMYVPGKPQFQVDVASLRARHQQ